MVPISRIVKGGKATGGKRWYPVGYRQTCFKIYVFLGFPPELAYFIERLCAAIVSLPPPILEVPRRAGQGSWRPGCPPDRQDRWPGNPSPLGKQQMSAISSSLSTLAGLVLPEPHSVEWGTAGTLFRGIEHRRYSTPYFRVFLFGRTIKYRQTPST